MNKKKGPKKENSKGKKIDIVSFENNGIKITAIAEPSFKVINGRQAVINKRARQILTKKDILNNRKAFIDRKTEEFTKKFDYKKKGEVFAEKERSKSLDVEEIDNDATASNNLVINGRKVKIVRKARKQETTNDSFKTRSKVLKDKKNNHLYTVSKKNKNSQFSLQMALPHPMLVKPRVTQTATTEKKETQENQNQKEFNIQMSLPKPMLIQPTVAESLKAKKEKSSKVPYYTAFIQSKAQARKNRERLSNNTL